MYIRVQLRTYHIVNHPRLTHLQPSATHDLHEETSTPALGHGLAICPRNHYQDQRNNEGLNSYKPSLV